MSTAAGSATSGTGRDSTAVRDEGTEQAGGGPSADRASTAHLAAGDRSQWAPADGYPADPRSSGGSDEQPSAAGSGSDRKASEEPASGRSAFAATSTGATSTGETSVDRTTAVDLPTGTPAAVDPFTAGPLGAGTAQAGGAPAVDRTAGTPAGDAAPPPPASVDEEPPEEQYDHDAAALVATLDDEVVVVDEQPRYHVVGCRGLVAKAVIPLPVSEAVELGFTPCSWCAPNRKLAAQYPAPTR